jgi:NAD(P) transhydrogenase subunit alpha
MNIGIPKESQAKETRVAATPKSVAQLIKLGYTVSVESGAGDLASFPDEEFVEAGAKIVDGSEVWKTDIVTKINEPTDDEIGKMEAEQLS